MKKTMGYDRHRCLRDMRPLYLIDSEWYECETYPAVARELARHPVICTVKEKRFQLKAAGVFFVGGRPIVVFPKNYCLPPVNGKDLLDDAKVLVRTLMRYHLESKSKRKESYFFGGPEVDSDSITSAVFILEDYCRNGLLRREHGRKHTSMSGSIDWPATIKSQDAIVSESGPVYLTPVMRGRVLDTSNPIHLIHKFVVAECFQRWGWLFGYDRPSGVRHRPAESAVEMALILSRELQGIYVEREILVIQHMIDFLLNFYGTKHEVKLNALAITYFSAVWEAVCGFVLQNQFDRLKTIIPQPEWESDVIYKRMGQRPDIFCVGGTGLFIVDAKYYDYHSGVPGWQDAVKQFFYRHTLNEVRQRRDFRRLLPDISNIFNVFVLPGRTADFKYIGKILVPDIPDLGEIKVFTINQKRALSSYAFRDDGRFNEVVRSSMMAAFS